MSHYLNTECPYCEKIITSEDELAVCPVCGTPHHRACYFELGHCFNESLHEEGFEWEPPVTANLAEPALIETVVCSACGKNTISGGAFCNYCGEPIAAKPMVTPYGGFAGRNRFFVDGQAPRYDPEEEIDGIPIRDWMAYIGNNHNYYLYNFKLQDKTRRKTSFTISAAAFPFLFFLYRRVWWAAILSAIANFLILIPYLVTTVFIPLGIDLGQNAVALGNATSVSRVLSLCINLGWGLFAVWLYRRKASRMMLKLKEESSSDNEYREKLNRSSGPSKAAVIVVGAVIFGLMFFTFFASELLGIIQV
ncbi:MAG: DUF2628 domain-containing protein [Oscillospiraceae bacterium]|nr:DUF2628 domain-containing protein [Oscillospiraceae bacterium]